MSVKWAKSYLGATDGDTAESWYGDYYAWGEIETKPNYSWSTYKYANGSGDTLTKYCNNAEYGNEGYTDELTQLVSEDDVATVSYGGNWRMPTKAECEELLAGTTTRWVENYNNIEGLNGRVFTSKVNGNTLFMPAAGYYDGSRIDNIGFDGSFWSSSLELDAPDCAYFLVYYADSVGENIIAVSAGGRDEGFSIRPVCK